MILHADRLALANTRIDQKRSQSQRHFGQTQPRKAPSATVASRFAPLAAILAMALLVLSSPTGLYAAGRPRIARAARTIGARDEADLHYVRHRSSEAHLFEE